MNCETIRDRRIADAYREGRLSPDEAAAYEAHYFDCDRCFEELRLRDQLAGAIAAEGERLFAAELAAEKGVEKVRRLRPRPWARRPVWGTVLAAAAVALVFIAADRTADRRALRALWTAVAYPYEAPSPRGGVEEVEFREAMELYAQGRYAESARRLSAYVETAGGDEVAFFYLGVARLLSRDAGGAAEALRAALERAPDSGLYEWYLAQAELQRGDGRKAAALLRDLAGRRDPHAADAAKLLEEIAKID